MATNNFLPFTPTDTGTNLLSNADYSAATDRTIGNQPGVASSKLVNKAIRQSSFMTSQLAQFVSNYLNQDVIDADGGETAILNQLNASFTPLAPSVQTFLSSSGTYNLSYKFFMTSGSATVGATYTNNAVTFTVKETVASGTILWATGSGAPAVSGTLTKTGGTGDPTIAFYAFRKPISINVKMVGGGGGGASSGTGSTNNGSDGGNSTFGTTLLVANGGTGGKTGSVTGGTGGTASLGAALGIAIQGQAGVHGGYTTNVTANSIGLAGGMGGNSVFSGAGISTYAADGTAAVTNSGSGGGGSGINGVVSSTTITGGGGSSGGYVDALINSPSTTYSYAVGAGGAAASAGTSGFAGGAGAAGIIFVTEFYQ